MSTPDPGVTIGIVALLILPSWLAALIDIRTRRIPNWLTAGALAVAFVGAAMYGRLIPALLGAALCLAAGIALALVAHRLLGGGFGGGDVKLMAHSGAVVGFVAGVAGVPTFLFWMSFAGGISALIVIAATRRRYASGSLTMPYGPAIAIGTTLTAFLA